MARNPVGLFIRFRNGKDDPAAVRGERRFVDPVHGKQVPHLERPAASGSGMDWMRAEGQRGGKK
jgi:hypothetical protein